MAKKIKGPITLNLNSERARMARDHNSSQDELFCRTWKKMAKECAFGIKVIADTRYYNLLYQNGEFKGLVEGVVYPFSHNYTKKGSRFRNRKIESAEVVCISKSRNLEMFWGTPRRYLVYEKDGTPYSFGARGSFYVEIDPADCARNADTLYHKLLLEADEEGMTVMDVKLELTAAYATRIGEQAQRMLEDLNRPLKDLAGLQASEMLALSKKVYKETKNLFSKFGLTITEASEGSIIQELFVEEKGKPAETTVPPFSSPSSFF